MKILAGFQIYISLPLKSLSKHLFNISQQNFYFKFKTNVERKVNK